MAISYFENLYTADSSVCLQDLLHLVDPMITDDVNEVLCKEFMDREIADALFDVRPLKSLGLDDFPAHFFQRNWDVLKQVVITGVKQFFMTGRMPQGVSDTTIVLIPKDLEVVKAFRPISLCNVIYKVVSKCLVNRLWPMLEELIAPTQSAFVPGRMITNNTLIAFECMHAMKSRNNSCEKFGAYKLDLTKAYDRVDWGYLEWILEHLGFHRKC
jgi:hypothetical protein